MTNKDYILSRYSMRKCAKGIPVLDSVLGFTKGIAAEATKNLTAEALSQLKLALPVTSVGLAWLLARAASPEAVADNAHEYATNALEKETLAQSIRDWESRKLEKALTSGKRKHHDQFI